MICAAYVLLFTAGRSGHVIGLLPLLRFLRGCRGCLIMDGCMYSNDVIRSFRRSAIKVTFTLRDQEGHQYPVQDYQTVTSYKRQEDNSTSVLRRLH